MVIGSSHPVSPSSSVVASVSPASPYSSSSSSSDSASSATSYSYGSQPSRYAPPPPSYSSPSKYAPPPPKYASPVAEYSGYGSSNDDEIDLLYAPTAVDPVVGNGLLPPPPLSSFSPIATRKDDVVGLNFIDSLFGAGTQKRILESVYKWFAERVRANPGCVERFVCESYRAGEEMEGIAYLLMKVTK